MRFILITRFTSVMMSATDLGDGCEMLNAVRRPRAPPSKLLAAADEDEAAATAGATDEDDDDDDDDDEAEAALPPPPRSSERVGTGGVLATSGAPRTAAAAELAADADADAASKHNPNTSPHNERDTG